jgi:tRNA A-37 threonylcarbamoyl transferase component Bud32
MATDPERLKSIFLDALDAPPAERQALLDKACAGDQELRQRVDAMLRANDRTDKLLDQPAAKLLTEGPSVPISPPSQLVGEKAGMIVAGRYQLQKLLGEGGMGSVWQAEQLHPVKRTVAIKLVKAGLDTKEVLHRFDAERQALAIMDHPHIAKVLDGGATDNGRPFFVMEYVPGQAVTEYCDTHRMDVDGRLALFVQICQAVQHAHQKGVIHRDIKPTNILVTEVDGKAVPKVIDFGLAKAVRETLSEATMLTSPGVIMGTLQYMSPEQAELNNTDIDTRVDVYALGVVLYELLTGTTPLEQQQIKKAAWLEMLRMIKELDPPLPSNRLSSSVSLPSLAAQRNLEPVRLAKLVRGDLDWIVMKALDKDRARRYDSANELGSDVTRYLTGDPVVAHPASSWYRVRKFLRRYRYQAIAAGLVLAALVVAVVGTTLGLLEAHHHEELALKERDAKEKARAAEAEQRRIAELRSARLSKGVEILGSVFTRLSIRTRLRKGATTSA